MKKHTKTIEQMKHEITDIIIDNQDKDPRAVAEKILEAGYRKETNEM